MSTETLHAKSPRNTPLLPISIGLISLAILLWLGITAGIYYLNSQNITSAAQAADMFGAANALFSALAFSGVILAIFLQREELQLQREELVYTRRELEKSAEAQQKSQEALNRQAESLLLAAYLEALTSLRQCYEDGEARSKQFSLGQFLPTPPQQARMFILLEAIVQNLEGKLPVKPPESTQNADEFALQYDKQRAIQAVREQHAIVASAARSIEYNLQWASSLKHTVEQAMIVIGAVIASPTQAIATGLSTGMLEMACRTFREMLELPMPTGAHTEYKQACMDLWGKSNHANGLVEHWLRGK